MWERRGERREGGRESDEDKQTEVREKKEVRVEWSVCNGKEDIVGCSRREEFGRRKRRKGKERRNET